MSDLLGWLIAIIWIAAIVAVGYTFVVKFWWLILIVAVAFYFWKKRKNKKAPQQNSTKINQKPDSSKVEPAKALKTDETKEIRNVKLPAPVNYDDVMYYLNNGPNIMTIEGGKHINATNGNPVLSANAIEQTKEKIQRFGHQTATYRHLVDLSLINPQEAVRQYFEVVATPYFEGGLLAYECGDWVLAEKWWLSIIDVHPYECSKRLAILYRKQHRYKDISDMYAVAINDSKKPYIHLRPGQDQDMVSAFMKASEKYLDKKDMDNSKGVKTYPSLIDMKFIDVLNGNENNSNPKELIGDSK